MCAISKMVTPENNEVVTGAVKSLAGLSIFGADSAKNEGAQLRNDSNNDKRGARFLRALSIAISPATSSVTFSGHSPLRAAQYLSGPRHLDGHLKYVS